MPQQPTKIKIGLIDDHQLFLASLSMLINSFQQLEVVFTAINGEDAEHKLKLPSTTLPDIILVDVNMTHRNGVDTVLWFKANHPTIKLIALSMNRDDTDVVQMIKAGCCSYLLKDIQPQVLEKAIQTVYQEGYYNSEMLNGNLPKLLRAEEQPQFTDKELQFMQLACSDKPYKTIAVEMVLAERTVDGYRENVFKKLQVTTRVGMVLEAVRRKLISL